MQHWQNGRLAQGNFCAHLVLKCDLVALKHPEMWLGAVHKRRPQNLTDF